MLQRSPIELEEGWGQMRDGINRLEKYLDEGSTENTVVFTAEEYMKLYTIIYNMCTQKTPHEYSDQLYSRYKQSIHDYLQQQVLARVQQSPHGVQLLRELAKAWTNHKLMVRWLTRFFNYLDRYFVVRHNLPNLEQVALVQFRDVIFHQTNVQAKDALLDLIRRERDNESIDRGLVKEVLSIFIDVGMDNIEIYKKDFQVHLLESVREYYKLKAADWIETDSCPEYLKKAEQALHDEEDRADSYLHPESKQAVLRVVQEELLTNVEQRLIEKDTGCSAMLRDNKQEDLSRLYRLYSRPDVEDGLRPIAEIVRKHIEGEGMALVNQVTAAGSSAGDGNASKKEAANAEQQFIKKVLALQDKYLEVVKQCFNAHTLVHKALKEAFESFCNKSVAGTSTAELMANYSDTLLRKGGGEKLTDEDLDRDIERVVKLLAYISDKDMFSEFYRKKLAKRLLGSNSGPADEHETAFLQRLKAQCGAHFTQKMEGMVNDLRVARDKQEGYEKWLVSQSADSKPVVDLEVKVLTTGFWPTYKAGELQLPAEMAACVTAFQKYYESTTRHRKLSWMHGLGNTVVKAQFAKCKKDLILAPYQAAVLVLFNDVEELSWNDVRERVGLPDEDVTRTLYSLTCAKYAILKRVGGESSSTGEKKKSKGITKEDVFRVNANFTDKMVRIRVPMPLVEDKKKVVEDVKKDRKYAIDAAIVRIMKSRKALEHQQLVVEVMQQVKRMFAADHRTIKKQLEELITREYLERDQNNPNLYKYLA